MLAVVVALPAQLLLWPPPWHHRLRTGVVHALEAIEQVLAQRTGVDADVDPTSASEALAASAEAAAALHQVFEATPVRPTPSSRRGLAMAKLVDDVEWLHSSVRLAAQDDGGAHGEADHVRSVWDAVARLVAAARALLAAGVAGSASRAEAATAVEQAVLDLRAAREHQAHVVARDLVERALAAAGPTSEQLLVDARGALHARQVADAAEHLGRHALAATGREVSEGEPESAADASTAVVLQGDAASARPEV
ncbi:hypothetical protein B7486_67690, partial [cyanobacterium TDX16]